MTRKPKVSGTDSGEAKPVFKSTPRNITVGPGDRAVLKCRVENLGTKTVSRTKIVRTPACSQRRYRNVELSRQLLHTV